jgi:hypothetical protein
MAHKNRRSKTEVILEAWSECDAQTAGSAELAAIQKTLRETIGAVESPARIARVLADEGIRLRHPEVINFDSAWRHRKIYELFGEGELEFDTLENALDSVNRVDDLFMLFESEGDSEGAKAVVELIREVKTELVTRKGSLAREVGQWLTVWLQNPQIFSDWLSLRRSSPEFIREFGQISG